MNKRGQIVVEYVLLLVLAVSLAALLVSRLVSREEGNEGILVAKWQNILQVIADDLPDKK
ncbi:hypothetical protein AB1A81_12485 [Bdellovibrio bacteriovorus]|uniref:Class III signal peptide-containing protein n=1 Tax=Bdellovibrio bacteriovorus TaxID=959 RepID=A0A1Z3N6L6_BDEBC|nr:hypothetical protein [Bdellovibrio bacteriovorus]AHZ85219.1 hypothetical protein EP01_09755 [Bdellovibrio bacteriovorus]ASD63096.1 hypothetical protein B9G79_05695 [Bdellovibrio bacteriovorus]